MALAQQDALERQCHFMEVKAVGRLIARSLLAERFEAGTMRRQVAKILNASPDFTSRLVARVLAKFQEGSRPRLHRVERFLYSDRPLARHLEKGKSEALQPVLAEDPRKMCPADGPPSTWPVLPILTIGDLAAVLNLTPGELAWFADLRGLERKTPTGPLRHYRYTWVRKRTGGARLIEAPKPRLKSIQRFILDRIVAAIPPDVSAHGFRMGCSIKTFALPHVKQEIVLRLDLRNFFSSIRRARILPIFLTAGYPESIAGLLTGLCANCVPGDVLRAAPDITSPSERRNLSVVYGAPHLPQGAPTSPALANLCAFRLDRRLAGLAESAGAVYTRYADDLLFSGGEEMARCLQRFHVTACRIALEEGFEVQTRKTRMMRRSVSQRAGGLVLNDKLNIRREEFDRLKAALFNCIRTGPQAQNRDSVADYRAHLSGRVAHVNSIHPGRGQKLKNLLDQIVW